jgi:hypothetical protein
MSDIFGNDSTGSMDMLVDISSATPQETVSLTFNNDLPQFKTSSKYFVSHTTSRIISKYIRHIAYFHEPKNTKWTSNTNIINVNSSENNCKVFPQRKL